MWSAIIFAYNITGDVTKIVQILTIFKLCNYCFKNHVKVG